LRRETGKKAGERIKKRHGRGAEARRAESTCKARFVCHAFALAIAGGRRAARTEEARLVADHLVLAKHGYGPRQATGVGHADPSLHPETPDGRCGP